jgi:hypothetical protein
MVRFKLPVFVNREAIADWFLTECEALGCRFWESGEF